MKTPLNDAVKKYLNHTSFHTPAHCGVISLTDITELSYSGNLFAGGGVIQESERLVSEAYGAEQTFFVTSGATTALHAAMAVFEGECVLVFGSAHKSVFSGLRLFAGSGYYMNDIEGLEGALRDIKPSALVVTSPDYFGNTLDLEYIKGLCESCGAALIVDAAHGSHFAFCDRLPVSATGYGDLVIHSLHKTMPVMTGGALLHCKREYAERAAFALSEIHTTSPSYPVMLSIESAVAVMSEEGGKLWRGVIDKVAGFAKALPSPYEVVKTDDPTRLVIASPYDGAEVCAGLERRGIFAEMSYQNKEVFIVNPYNADKLHLLGGALSEIKGLKEYNEATAPPIYKAPRKLLLKASYELTAAGGAAGRVLYREIGYYPPGVPLYLPGQELDERDAAFLQSKGKMLFGLDNGRVYVVS
jgi:arginine/lysine/ornithine decarboxylase